MSNYIDVPQNGFLTEVTQVAHGLSIPSFGFLPVYYNNVSGLYEPANANDVTTAADAVVVDIPDSDTLTIQEQGYIYGTHGLDIGKWYVLRAGLAGLILPLDTLTGSEANVQYLCFVADSETLVLRMDPIFTKDLSGPAISILENWVQGSPPTISAGTNRMMQININWEDSVTNAVTGVTMGGVAATLVEEQTITSGFSQGCHVFCWLESEIAAMVGSAVVLTWSNGTAQSFQTSYALFENVNQVTPIVDTNTDSGTGGTDTLDADVDTEEDGYVFVVCSGGNAGMGFTNNGTGFTRQLDLVYSSADGVLDDKFVTADTTQDNINMSITGSNRHVMVASSYRKA